MSWDHCDVQSCRRAARLQIRAWGYGKEDGFLSQMNFCTKHIIIAVQVTEDILDISKKKENRDEDQDNS